MAIIRSVAGNRYELESGGEGGEAGRMLDRAISESSRMGDIITSL